MTRESRKESRSIGSARLLLFALLVSPATGAAQQESDSEKRLAPGQTLVPSALVPMASGPADRGVRRLDLFRGVSLTPPPDVGPVAPQDDVQRDAWGQPRNMGLAIVEASLANLVPWVFNEIVPGRAELRISQLSPRSWWRNLEQGWEWDDNAFQVNYFAHPFQGNLYFNAARANGYGYFTGLLFATAGSFHWECCGETHYMSINDWVNTSIGGAAVGEVLYRSSSRILDNEATGAGRFFREAAAFMINPNRGLTRLITGNATRVYDNPEDPLDRHPDGAHSHVAFGARQGNSTRTAVQEQELELPSHGFVRMEVHSGDLATLTRGQPFDYFKFTSQINMISGRGIGEILIQGNLWHRNLSETESAVSKFVVMQDFEYNNNSSFEQGGQGVAFTYFREQRWDEDTWLSMNVAPTWTLLGGLKSELAFAAEVEGIRERFREYDFGIGPGFRVGFEWVHDGYHVMQGSYRAKYLETVNGSSKEGVGSDHLTQLIRIQASLPFEVAGLSLGADYERFLRRSNFELRDIGLVKQDTSLWQIFLRWSP